MQTLPDGWMLSRSGLTKIFVWKNFPEAIAFVMAIGKVAEDQNHHPDIDMRWNRVTLTLCTHDAGYQVTDKDYILAQGIEEIDQDAVKSLGSQLYLAQKPK